MDFGDLGDVGGAIRGNADPHQQRNSCLDFPRLFTGTRSEQSPQRPPSLSTGERIRLRRRFRLFRRDPVAGIEAVEFRKLLGRQRIDRLAQRPDDQNKASIMFYADTYEAAEAGALYGMPDEIIAKLQALQDVGAEYLLLNSAGWIQSLRRFAKEVVKTLASAFKAIDRLSCPLQAARSQLQSQLLRRTPAPPMRFPRPRALPWLLISSSFGEKREGAGC